MKIESKLASLAFRHVGFADRLAEFLHVVGWHNAGDSTIVAYPKNGECRIKPIRFHRPNYCHRVGVRYYEPRLCEVTRVNQRLLMKSQSARMPVPKEVLHETRNERPGEPFWRKQSLVRLQVFPLVIFQMPFVGFQTA